MTGLSVVKVLVETEDHEIYVIADTSFAKGKRRRCFFPRHTVGFVSRHVRIESIAAFIVRLLKWKEISKITMEGTILTIKIDPKKQLKTWDELGGSIKAILEKILNLEWCELQIA